MPGPTPDSRTGEKFIPSNIGFATSEEPLGSPEEIRDWCRGEYDTGNVSISPRVERAFNGGGTPNEPAQIWVLRYNDRVEVVTGAEYRDRLP